MAYFRALKKGGVQATIRLKGITQYRTFLNKKLAKSWATDTEKQIKTIPALTERQLIALSDDDIATMGGVGLFNKLGVNLFSIRNAAKLEVINQLSKKELLQLMPHKIEAMGGAELFKQAGKRIRYVSFREVCGEYLEQWNKKDYKNQLIRVNYWASVFGDKVLTDIDIFDVREHIDLMLKDQRATTVCRKKAVLSSIFKYALSQGYIDDNFIGNVKVENDAKTRDRILTDLERNAFLDACQQSHWNKLKLLVLMAITSGARKSELLQLRWCNVDFKQNIAILYDTKNGTDRRLALPAVVITELNRFKEIGNGLIFSGNTDKPKDIRKAWVAALKLADISGIDTFNDDGTVKLEKFTFHCLRHGFCSALSASGKELSQIGKMAGHKSLQTTMRYIHQGDKEKTAITEELAMSFGI